MTMNDSVKPLAVLFQHEPETLGELRRLAAVKRKVPGILLVTGPVSQGKTTTITALQYEMDRTRLEIVSIDNPTEHVVPFVRHIEFDRRDGATWSRASGQLIGMDPDVCFLSEINDRDSAGLGFRVTECGYFCVATLHAGSAVGSLYRLIKLVDDGDRAGCIDVLAYNLVGVVNQRLAQRVCSRCASTVRAGDRMAPELLKRFGMAPADQIRIRQVGERCLSCAGTGSDGRVVTIDSFFAPVVASERHSFRRALAAGEVDDIASMQGVVGVRRVASVARLVREQVIDPDEGARVMGWA